MSDQPHPDSAPLSASQWRRIDQICNSFEEAWKAGQRPQLTDFLATTLEPERSVLLRELLVLELAYRRKSGDTPGVEEYRHLFPEQAELVEAVFRDNGFLPGERERDTRESYPATQPGSVMAGVPPASPAIPGYHILSVLGQGGMGIVYKARQLIPIRLVALKMILGADHCFPEQQTRFRAEAEAIARLNHPNIVQIYEVGEHAGQPFFSLEFVEGATLAHKVAATPPQPLEAAALVETLARAMHHAHQRGLVHRDLKPANVLLREDGVPKITDFGLARFLDSETRLTQTRDFLGTPAYTSPEQASGQAYVAGPAADVYSLGGILYFLLTTQPPFQETSVQRVLEQVRTQEPVPPRRFQPGCPRDLETICLKCLRKEPHKRYSSAEELAEDLHQFLQGKPIHARPTPRWERLLKWCKRRPTTASLTGVVVLLTLLVAVGWTVVNIRERWRLHDLRRDMEIGLRDSQEAADRHQWLETDVHLNNVQKGVANEPSLEDLKARSEKLRKAFARFRLFLQQRDEALFQGIYVTLFPGQGRAAPPNPVPMEEELTSWLSERQRAEMAVSYYEVRLVRADLVADYEGARRALDLLKEADASSGKTSAYHFLKGIHFYLQGEREQAVCSFETALRLQPDHFWSLFFLAVNQLHMGNWVAAEYSLNTCQLQRPGFLWVLLLRGYAQVEQAKFSAAEDDFRQAEAALDHYPAALAAPTPGFSSQARAALHLYRGILYLRQQKLTEATDHFHQAKKEQRTFHQPYVGLIRVCMQQDQLKEADKHFQELQALNPPAVVLAEYHILRAKKLVEKGKNREAVDACNRAVAVRREHAEAYAVRGQALLQLEDFKNAADSFTSYLAFGGRPQSDVYLGRGQALVKQDRFLDAGEDYSRALELTVVPDGMRATVGLAAVVWLHRQEAELLVHRGEAWFFSNAFELAQRDFDRALQFPPLRSVSYTWRGLCKVMLGHCPAAIADAEDALKLNPATPEMRFNVACIFSLAVGKVNGETARPRQLDLEAKYRTAAVEQIRLVLRMLSPEQRSAFWEKKWRCDPALDPIRDSTEFAQLEKDYLPSLQKRPDHQER